MSNYNQDFQGAGVYPPAAAATYSYPPAGHPYPAASPVQGPYIVPPPVSYPMKTEAYPQQEGAVPYHQDKGGKGGGFWTGCCSAMFCCCLCDLCCLPCSIF